MELESKWNWRRFNTSDECSHRLYSKSTSTPFEKRRSKVLFIKGPLLNITTIGKSKQFPKTNQRCFSIKPLVRFLMRMNTTTTQAMIQGGMCAPEKFNFFAHCGVFFITNTMRMAIAETLTNILIIGLSKESLGCPSM